MQSEGVLPTGIVKSKGGGGKKDMCKANGCYQREMCKVMGATNGNSEK